MTAPPEKQRTMTGRLAALIVGLLAALVAVAAPAAAHIDRGPGRAEPGLTLVGDPNATSTTSAPPAARSDLPGTTLEAQERDDGNTSAAPWVIGSGLAALVAIGIGGALLKRRMG